jgi:hypothetical protein
MGDVTHTLAGAMPGAPLSSQRLFIGELDADLGAAELLVAVTDALGPVRFVLKRVGYPYGFVTMMEQASWDAAVTGAVALTVRGRPARLRPAFEKRERMTWQ